MNLIRIKDVLVNLENFDFISLEDDKVFFGKILKETGIGLTFSTNPDETTNELCVLSDSELRDLKLVLDGSCKYAIFKED